MKVLLLDVNCKYSSTGKIVYDLYTQLKAEGHEAAVGYGRGPRVKEKNICRFSPVWEVYLHAFLTRVTGNTGCFSYIGTKRLLGLIKVFRPDVVHLNDMHGYFVNIIPLMEYLKRNQIKTVWTFHCEFMYTGKCGHSYECGKWKKECGNCGQLKEYPASLFFDKTKKMYRRKKKAFENFNHLTIVTPSDWLADRVRQSFLKDKKIVTIHNGINTEIFHKKDASRLRRKLGLGDEKVVLAAAPDLLSERKGGKYVLQAARRMREQNVKFILVGITDLSQKFDDNVIPVARIRDQELLAEYYCLADVFVICSKRETFSMTVAEALCCGTPVAGFKAGAPETIAIAQYSSFAEYGDRKAFVSCVQKLLNSDFNRKEISTNAQTLYRKEGMFLSYLKLYEEKR